MVIVLEIDGREVGDLHRYALRFYDTPAGPRLSLYRDGKRVTAPFHVVLDVKEEGDASGGNANTAD